MNIIRASSRPFFILGIGILLAVAISIYAFQEPTSAPPTGNVATPVNVGSVGQAKSGGLILGTNCISPCEYGLLVDKGKVGINTLTPGTALHVAGAVESTGAQSFLYQGGNADGTADVVLRNDGFNSYLYPWGAPGTENGLVIGASTNVLISDALAVGAGVVDLVNPAGAASLIYFHKNPTNYIGKLHFRADDNPQTYEPASEVLTLTADGHVGINTGGNPGNVPLTVSSSLGGDAMIALVSATPFAGIYMNTTGGPPFTQGRIDLFADGSFNFRSTSAPGIVIGHSSNVGIGVAQGIDPQSKLEVNGGVRLNTTTAKPTCNAATRGVLWFTQGGSGVKDALEVCAKNSAGSYAWRLLY